MAKTSLPPGFRFHPTDVELVMYYLKRKVMGKRLHVDAVAEVNIYMFSPWDLPDKSALKSKDLEWFFFCPREKKYASGSRVKRATENGYWKTTGKDRPVSYNGRIVGTVKTLVFHLGHAPKGERTDWVIHEYRILDEKLAAAGVQDNYVLCKVFQKDGPGPKNGAQYGAPFNEADWVDSDADETREDNTSPTCHGPFPTMPMLTGNGSSNGTFSFHLGSTSKLPEIEKGPSAAAGLSANPPQAEMDDEVTRLLSIFEREDTFISVENESNQDNLNCHIASSEVNDMYNDLADLEGWDPMTGSTLECSGMPINDFPMLDGSFIELDDLHEPMNDQAVFTMTDHHTAGDVLGSFDYLKACDFFSEGSCVMADRSSSAATQLPVCFERSSQSDNSLDMLVMELIGSGNLDCSERSPENGVCFTQDVERGTVKIIVVSRFIPAAELIDAQILLLWLYPVLNDGSSIHIKAEVTHRDGECTKEALRVMMEGSCSFLSGKHSLKFLCVIFWRFSCGIIIIYGYSWIIVPHASTPFVVIIYVFAAMFGNLIHSLWSDVVTINLEYHSQTQSYKPNKCCSFTFGWNDIYILLVVFAD